MKVNLNLESFGTTTHMNELVNTLTIKIGANYSTKTNGDVIEATAVMPVSRTCSGTQLVVLARYNGNLQMNGGLESINPTPPFQLTEGGKEVWKKTVKLVEASLISYIKNM